MLSKHLIESISKTFKMICMKNNLLINIHKTFSEQIFTKHCQQMLVKHVMYVAYQTFHDECLKNISSITFIYLAIL